jgi:glutamate carboxypeptidase
MLMAVHGVHEPELSMSPGLVLGGTQVEHDEERDRGRAHGKENVVAERAITTGDLRPLSLAQRERVKSLMQEASKSALPQTSSIVIFRDSYPPMEPSDANRSLLAMLDRASRDLGEGGVAAANVRKLGAADISFAAPHVRAAIDGLGLGGEGGHTVHEQADLRTLPLQAKRAALLMLRLSGGALAAP